MKPSKGASKEHMLKFEDLRLVGAVQSVGWLEAIAADLRPAERDELAATFDLDPLQSLVASVMLSARAWVVLEGEQPLAVFGVAPDPDALGSGLVWMRSAAGLDRQSVVAGLLRAAPGFIREMEAVYPHLWNRVDVRNAGALAFAGRLGFTATGLERDYGRERRPFRRIERGLANV